MPVAIPDQYPFATDVALIITLMMCGLIVVNPNHPFVRSSTDPRVLFGKRVRELRRRAGLTQESLAERAHLHRNYVGGVERGERNISLINIVELARALSVRPAQLLKHLP